MIGRNVDPQLMKDPLHETLYMAVAISVRATISR